MTENEKKLAKMLRTTLASYENGNGISVTNIKSLLDEVAPINQNELKKANADIARLVETASISLKSATEIADEYGLSFSFCPAYGMGGTYMGGTYSGDGGWNSSSQNC